MKITCLENKRIAVLAPHNDDEVIGCWFLMEALSGLADIRVVVVTYNSDNPDLTACRRDETRTVLAGIGIFDIQHWDIPDGSAHSFAPRIAEQISAMAVDYDFVLCPAPNDRTPDHIPVAQAAYDGLPAEKLIWYRSTWWTFPVRNADFKVTGDFSAKKAALACFKSQAHISLFRCLIYSRFESFLAYGTFSAAEAFTFASVEKLAAKPLNSISLGDFPRLLFWR